MSAIAVELQQPTSRKGQLLDVTLHLETVILTVSFGEFALQNAHKLQLFFSPHLPFRVIPTSLFSSNHESLLRSKQCALCRVDKTTDSFF